MWRSASRLVFRSGATWYEVVVDPSSPRPGGEPREVFSDPQFIDTRGSLNVLAPDGGVIYVRMTRLSAIGPHRCSRLYAISQVPSSRAVTKGSVMR